MSSRTRSLGYGSSSWRERGFLAGVVLFVWFGKRESGQCERGFLALELFCLLKMADVYLSSLKC